MTFLERLNNMFSTFAWILLYFIIGYSYFVIIDYCNDGKVEPDEFDCLFIMMLWPIISCLILCGYIIEGIRYLLGYNEEIVDEEELKDWT